MLRDDQWKKIEPLLPKAKPMGRPCASNRAVFEGILWVLRNGARWRDLPANFPSGVTCWRRLRQWEERGVWLKAWRKLLSELDQKGLLEWEETFLDASFAPAKKGALQSDPRGAARARNGWYWSTAKVFLWEHSWRLPRRTK
jgi:hypothetical protein